MSKDLLVNDHGDEELNEYDYMLLNIWEEAKNLCDSVVRIPHAQIYEAQKTIDDVIGLLELVKLGLEQRKQ